VRLVQRLRFFIRDVQRKRRFETELKEGAPTAKPGPHPLVVVLDHPRPRRNAAAIVRTADAFGARAVYVVGTTFFDPVPAVGSLRNVPLRFFHSFAQAHAELAGEGYAMFALEPAHDFKQPKLLHLTTLDRKTALIIGHETLGLSFDPSAYADVECLAIEQYGVVPCLNASVAASIAMYEYARQHAG
jgi:tRNA G18 (ribose-2'-O)-methylase SpoU